MGVTFAAAHAAAASAVWVQTNQPTGNSIVVYDRGADGRLTRAGIYATGGDGGLANSDVCCAGNPVSVKA